MELIPDGFMQEDPQGQKRILHELLGNPEFIDFINSSFVIESYSDGARMYPSAEIITYNMSVLNKKDEKDNDILEIYKIISDGLIKATEDFTEEGSFETKGKPVFDLVDQSMLVISQNRLDPDSTIKTALEIVTHTAINMAKSCLYEDYQVDISVSGQGLLHDTYSLNIKFKPISKNVDYNSI
jgi:hypothetical protein